MKKLLAFLLCAAMLLACVSSALADEMEAEVVMTADRDYDVYSAPDTVGVPRGANNDAVLPAGTEFEVYNFSDNTDGTTWLLIQYAVDEAHSRFGYILADKAKSYNIGGMSWDYEPATLLAETALTDDPLGSQSELVTLPEGQIVYTLATLGDWVYVSSSSGDWVQGFVKAESLSFDRSFSLMYFEFAAGGALAVTQNNRVKLDMVLYLTFCPDLEEYPAAFLLKDELQDIEIGLAEITAEERYALDAPLPDGTTSISFIPVDEDGTPGETLFRVEW